MFNHTIFTVSDEMAMKENENIKKHPFIETSNTVYQIQLAV